VAQASAFGDEIHSDLWGPSPTSTISGCKYYATFTDDYSCYTSIELLKSKDETLNVYKNFAAWAQTQHSSTVWTMLTGARHTWALSSLYSRMGLPFG
jgi:hypothetical protein